MEYWASDNYALFNVEVKSLKNLFHKNHGTGIIVFIICMPTGKAGVQVLIHFAEGSTMAAGTNPSLMMMSIMFWLMDEGADNDLGWKQCKRN